MGLDEEEQLPLDGAAPPVAATEGEVATETAAVEPGSTEAAVETVAAEPVPAAPTEPETPAHS